MENKPEIKNTYTTVINGQEVEVKVYAPGKSGRVNFKGYIEVDEVQDNEQKEEAS